MRYVKLPHKCPTSERFELIMADFDLDKVIMYYSAKEFWPNRDFTYIVIGDRIFLIEMPYDQFDKLIKSKQKLTVDNVIEWMNQWEQLKDGIIPIRFKEDFSK